ncbi:hypothetical protein AWENTII_011458 [Aspergillus wentii]
MSSTPATFKPALILHGGAGSFHRSTLPPDLYAKYHTSLLSYLRSTNNLLNNGGSALDAAVHAVSLMEDDELFNCGRGSVFTSAGTIEMEASVMVTSVQKGDDLEGAVKRGAGVIGLKNVRHPIRLARESLLRTGYNADGEPNGDGGNMHSQLAAPVVEELAREWGLEFKPDEWFWTKERWDEHLRGLKGEKEPIFLSQGTVGCVCLDQWGNLAVATSTGGLTNKLPGRIGDTPTLGAGFWAEAWDVDKEARLPLQSMSGPGAGTSIWDMTHTIRSLLADCMPPFLRDAPTAYTALPTSNAPSQPHSRHTSTRRAIAVSGTGNGDSFLRVVAARTASAMLRFSAPNSFPNTLAEAVTAVAGPNGELQRSAGKRWGKTAEGAGGIIGIEAEADTDTDVGATLMGEKRSMRRLKRGKVVFDFNSGGMWRTWIEEDANGRDVERVMVFREEHQ